MILVAVIIAAFQLILLMQAVKNRALFRRLNRPQEAPAGGAISICLPMRNEEANAERMLNSVLASRTVISEVLVLDDGSTDRTPEILRQVSERHLGLVRIIKGKAKPDDWRAKVWAMNQLAEAAHGERLLFIDADVRLDDEAIASIVQGADAERANYFSIFPKQLTSRSTDLLVDHVFTTLWHLLPMQFVADAKYPGAVAGCGQVQLISRSALAAIGGYEALRDSLHDGLHTARLVKRAGMGVGFAYGVEMVSCEMYPSFREAWQGFTRNAFQASGSLVALLVTSLVLLLAFVGAPVVAFIWGGAVAAILVIPTIGLYAHYASLAAEFGLRRDFVLRLPLSVILSSAVQWWSYLKHKLGLRTAWRGRAA